MSFIEEVKNMENERKNKEKEVCEDIINFFKNKMKSEKFEENLKRYIKDAIDNGKSSVNLKIEFWEYISGCSSTYIYVSCCGEFKLTGKENDYDSYYCYKGIRLKNIHKDLCNKLSNLFKDKIEELGLKIVNSERLDDNYKFNYYKENITIKW